MTTKINPAGKTKREWAKEIIALMEDPRITKGDHAHLSIILTRLEKFGMMPRKFAMSIFRVKEDLIPGKKTRQEFSHYLERRETRRLKTPLLDIPENP